TLPQYIQRANHLLRYLNLLKIALRFREGGADLQISLKVRFPLLTPGVGVALAELEQGIRTRRVGGGGGLEGRLDLGAQGWIIPGRQRRRQVGVDGAGVARGEL